LKNIPLIVCIIFLAGGLFGTYQFYDLHIQLTTKLGQASNEVKKAGDAAVSAEEDLEGWQALSGAPRVFMEKLVADARLEGQDATTRSLIVLRTNQRDKANADLTSVTQRRDEAIAAAKSAYQNLRSTESRLKSEITSTLEQWIEIVRKIDADAKRMASDVVNEAEKYKQLNDTIRKEHAGWDDEKGRLKEDTEFMTVQLSRLQEDINPQIDLLAEPDAVVITSEYGKQFVVLNIGHNQGAKAGMVFTVFRRTSEGHLLDKGKVRVSTVHDDYCEAGILESKKLFPIIAGDYAQSAEFPQRLRYYFYGDYGGDETLGYAAEELGQLAEATGGLVLSRVDITTDIVVLGDIARLRDTDEFAEVLKVAREFQIKIMRVRKFLRELRK